MGSTLEIQELSVGRLYELADFLKDSKINDCGEYRIGFGLRGGLVGSYVQSDVGFLRPSQVIGIKKKISRSDNHFKELKNIAFNTGQHSYQMIKNTCDLFFEHPLVGSYLIGKSDGNCGEYHSVLEVDGEIDRFPTREVTQDDVDLAITSGAVFGKKIDSEIDSIYLELAQSMRSGIPFNRLASKLFGDGYNPDFCPPFTPKIVLISRQLPRFKKFENALFKSTIERIHDSYQD